MTQPKYNWREKVKQLWETTPNEHEEHLGEWSRWKTDGGRRLEEKKSDIEKKGRKGRTEDESISRLL